MPTLRPGHRTRCGMPSTCQHYQLRHSRRAATPTADGSTRSAGGRLCNNVPRVRRRRKRLISTPPRRHRWTQTHSIQTLTNANEKLRSWQKSHKKQPSKQATYAENASGRPTPSHNRKSLPTPRRPPSPSNTGSHHPPQRTQGCVACAGDFFILSYFFISLSL